MTSASDFYRSRIPAETPRCRVRIAIHHFGVGIIKLLPTELRQAVVSSLVGLRRSPQKIDILLLRNTFQFIIGLGMIGHHALPKFLHGGVEDKRERMVGASGFQPLTCWISYLPLFIFDFIRRDSKMWRLVPTSAIGDAWNGVGARSPAG
jgi:hypothetical protein